MRDEYVRRVLSVERYTDGDTGWTWIDQGYYGRLLTHWRLHDLDTPELNPRHAGRTEEGLTLERVAAVRALDMVREFFEPEDQTLVTTIWQESIEEDPDQFGRWLVRFTNRLWTGDMESLHELLLAAGLAVVSPGGQVKWHVVKGVV